MAADEGFMQTNLEGYEVINRNVGDRKPEEWTNSNRNIMSISTDIDQK